MKAILCPSYGSPDILELREVPKPVPKPHEVLVRVRATAVNDFDWSLVRGKPYPYRLMFGLRKPKKQIPGIELSGTVEEVGNAVTQLKVGDHVYGDISAKGWGSFAEYACVDEQAMALKPESMSFEQAAAIPHASMLASQGLIDAGKIQQGQKILINGAGGGMGTFGIQIAKLYGAEVTGVDTGDKLEMMEVLGFDHVIDYRKEDFTRNGQQYDLILDAKTTRAPSAYLRSLAPNGSYVTVGGYLGRLIQVGMARLFGRKNLHIVALKQNKDLAFINELFEAGKIKPIVDGPYTIDETDEVLQYFGEGKHYGKIVMSL